MSCLVGGWVKSSKATRSFPRIRRHERQVFSVQCSVFSGSFLEGKGWCVAMLDSCAGGAWPVGLCDAGIGECFGASVEHAEELGEWDAELDDRGTVGKLQTSSFKLQGNFKLRSSKGN